MHFYLMSVLLTRNWGTENW